MRCASSRVSSGLRSPIDPWFKDLSHTYPHDVDKAKQLLQEAGVSGLKLTLDVVPTPYAKASAPVIKEQLAAVGINVTLNDVQFDLWPYRAMTPPEIEALDQAATRYGKYLRLKARLALP